MNSESPRPPFDPELDRLLGSKLRRTSPEFELRWRELRAELAGVRAPVRAKWMPWLRWPGLGLATLAAVATLFLLQPTPAPRSQPVSFEELIALDAALQPASSLLVAENRDALLNLPAQPRG